MRKTGALPVVAVLGIAFLGAFNVSISIGIDIGSGAQRVKAAPDRRRNQRESSYRDAASGLPSRCSSYASTPNLQPCPACLNFAIPSARIRPVRYGRPLVPSNLLEFLLSRVSTILASTRFRAAFRVAQT